MSTKLHEEAIKRITAAVEADNAGKLEEAFDAYSRGLEVLQQALQFEKLPQIKKQLTDFFLEKLTRCEEIKKTLADRKEGKGSGPVSSSSSEAVGKSDRDDKGDKDNKGDKDDKDEEMDPEMAKLQKGLAGAILGTKPDVKWEDVCGLEQAKAALKEAVILPAKFPQLFTDTRRPWKGILLYGPPGTGKSYLAQAVATEAQSTFFSVSSSDLVSKWQGESEKLVKNLFEMARKRKPAILFIDEIDSLCGARGEGESESSRRIKTEFLVQMQGVGKTHDGILVLGATNTPWSLDPAMRRRFEKRIYIALPSEEARSHMFGIHLGDTETSMCPADFEELGKISEGYSGSDISVAVREALMQPLRECQEARFFRPDEDGMLSPELRYPPCAVCPMELSNRKLDDWSPAFAAGSNSRQCKRCGCIRIDLMDMNFEPEKLKVPVVTMDHFRQVLERGGGATVSPDELTQFESWTHEFGQDG